MITASKAVIAFCLLAVAGTVLVIGPTELRRMLPGGASTEVAAVTKPESKPEAKAEAKDEAKLEAKPEVKVEPKTELKVEEPKLAAAAPPAPSVAPVTADAPKPDALAETRKQVTALADVAPVKPQPSVADTGPRFDVARVDDHGEAAVIAGQAAPGAKVELLRDGQPLDSVVADASGQFVMTPPKLPAGSYELALRAHAPDGTVTQSGRTMPVTIAEVAPPARVTPVAKQDAKPDAKPDDKSDVVAALPSPRLAAVPERSAVRPRLMGAPKPKSMARVPAAGPTVASASPADALTTGTVEAGGSRVISRGDSLWALSRLAYGDGARYAVIFNANREKIHNPNLIYPGQTVVVPQKAQ
ncbi:LysM peptidoglycan-binding domain-containing protein [Bradyrhizobium guangdongense]|uniref:Peptidoglycan-binding protein LysM n=1 Tax=Bradyrhizobium guangdongense TaxID=1325090 RepID=A0A410UYZ9_9BRAD|nr:LysM peptidoglycan-binding domain-containing protein [Bradyrhizobium guangdongense]QAU36677.1 peptidoglycan-binding protein LysM [Bradyrhizobium guangdongense]QOZ57729.1 peptidoglycan-binding protein LysM [Bradyrhizobium guangdongense]GGI28200.1 peptidoglycan-binding protein LysM [Bradyrhizobium guangdongense]